MVPRKMQNSHNKNGGRISIRLGGGVVNAVDSNISVSRHLLLI